MNRFIKLSPMLALLTMASAGLWAQDTDPFPDVNPYDFYGSMIMSMKARAFSEEPLQDVIVTVYAGDEIRAKGRPRNTENPGIIYLTIYGNTAGEKLHFKVYAKGIIIEADPGLTYVFNDIVGSPRSPYILELGQYIPHSGISVESTDGHHTVHFDGTSETAVHIPVPLTFDDIEYNRDFTPGHYTSVFLPFDVTSDMTIVGGKFYRFTNVTHIDKWRATMTEVHELEANRPYLFVPEDTKLTIHTNGHKVTTHTELREPETRNGWTFRGSYEKIEWTSESRDYGFTSRNEDGHPQREFVRFADGDYILPLHCYLSYVGDNASPADTPTALRLSRRAESIILPDTVEILLTDEYGVPVGICETGSSMVKENVWFDLSGRKIAHRTSELPALPQGIYIHDKRKVIVK